MHNFHFSGGWMIWFWVILIVGLIIGFLQILKTNYSESSQANEKPLDTLKRRFANGEISKNEFKEKKEALMS